MRSLITFSCAGETLLGTLDDAAGTTGLLIMSGGNEIRIGAHRGMAELAASIAASGHPVFRFDRRGVGDSSGANGGYALAGPDLAAAMAAFRAAAPHITRLVGFGNCDGATALLLHGAGAFDRLLLANPWIVDDGVDDDLPPAAAIRARYAERLRDPGTWLRLARGNISLTKLVRGLTRISMRPSDQATVLSDRVFAALASHPDVTVLLARGDATAIAFADAARRRGYGGTIDIIDTASHSFARPADKSALEGAVRRVLG